VEDGGVDPKVRQDIIFNPSSIGFVMGGAYNLHQITKCSSSTKAFLQY
jgi:hypothetical protein